ncbi:hypothetical protein ABPG77_003485 [Micractinium sp. CCAP 211/92]
MCTTHPCFAPKIRRWTFTASVCISLCAGLTYCFAIWSGELRSTFGLSQPQLELIASAANIGGYSGIFSGLAYDALERHKRFGPRVVLALGCLLNAAGYLGLWAALQGLFEARFWHLVLLAAVAANAGSWLDTTILATNVRNFPSSRGTVVGIMKAGIGLSGSLFASVYSGVFAPARTPFLLFLALAPAAVGLLALPLINTCTFVQVCELETGQHVFTTEGRFIFTLQTLGTLAVFLITGATVEALHPLTARARLVMTAGAGLLLLPLLVIPHGSGGLLSHKAQLHQALSMYHHEEEEEEREGAGEGDAEAGAVGSSRGWVGAAHAGGAEGAPDESLKQPLLEPAGMQRGGTAGAAAEPGAAPSEAAGPAGGARRTGPSSSGAASTVSSAALPELSPAQCLCSSNFWLLFAALTISMGSGLTLLNNLAQVVKALSGVPHEDTPVLVSLFSVANCAGRMALGYLPERLLHSRGTPRLLFLPAMSALMSAACLALAFAPLRMLYPLAALTGFAFGGHWTLFPSLVSELFGLARFAANYTLAQLAPALGSLTLATGLAGWLYSLALSKQGSEGGTCLGPDCFRPTFLVLAGLGLGATVCSTVLYRRIASPGAGASLYHAMHAELNSYDAEVQERGEEAPGHGMRRRRAGRTSTASGSGSL